MFTQLAFAFAFVAPFVTALTVSPLEGATSGGRTNVTWQAFEGDPATFSIELRNPVFNNQFAIANNVDASLQRMELLLPIVPAGGGYFLDLVDIGNITNVFAESPEFSIGEVVSSTSTSTSTGTGTRSSTIPPTASGTTFSIQTTTPGTPPVTGTSTTGTGTTTSPAGTTTPFNGAAALGVTGSNANSYGLMVMAAFVGAALVGF